jgi:hypothetical protein
MVGENPCKLSPDFYAHIHAHFTPAFCAVNQGMGREGRVFLEKIFECSTQGENRNTVPTRQPQNMNGTTGHIAEQVVE